MKRFAASIEYFGTNYNGWQKQSQTTETIQEKVENAFSSIANEVIHIFLQILPQLSEPQNLIAKLYIKLLKWMVSMIKIQIYTRMQKDLKNLGLMALTHFFQKIFQLIGLKALTIRLMHDFLQLTELTNI